MKREFLAVHFDPIALRVDGSFRITTDSVVQGHSPRADEIKRFRPRAIATLGKRTGQTDSPG
jgi:hypothetical protein